MKDFIKEPGNVDIFSEINDWERHKQLRPISYSVSANNIKMVRYYLEQVLKNNPNAVIVEIGVARDNPSTTENILSMKPDTAKYLGIDIVSKAHLNNPSKNIFTIQSPSEQFDTIDSFFKSHGVEKIDFLFIDGNHSINQCLLEWKYVTDYLAETGVVGWHDTNYHAGPLYIVDNLNTEKWTLANHPGIFDADCGIAFHWLKSNTGIEPYSGEIEPQPEPQVNPGWIKIK